MASNSRRGLEGDGGGQDAGGGQAGRTRARQMPRSLSELEIRNIIQSQLDDDSEGEDVAELNGNADGWDDSQDMEDDEPDIHDNSQYEDPALGLRGNTGGQPEDEDSDEADANNNAEEVEDVGPTRPKRVKLRDRYVNSLENALDGNNYDPYEAPTEKKVVTGVFQKKERNIPEEKISW